MVSKSSLLHVCSYYPGNKLYKSLFQVLDRDFDQFIYIPIKHKKNIGVNSFVSSGSKLYYDCFLKPYHRYLYGLKIASQARRLEKIYPCDLSDIKIIHAHTLFSDGGSAYILSKRYNIPYIVSIRNTDLNYFYKYAIHYRSLAHNVLLSAKQVVFLSYAYRDHFFNTLPQDVVEQIECKCLVVPNGISDLFFAPQIPKMINTEINLITVASLDKNKNISTMLEVVQKLKAMGKQVSLKVAGTGLHRKHLEKIVKKKGICRNVEFLGYIDAAALKLQLDDSNIFALLSLKETFGISYIEAMARGLPVIYTRNQGIDGYFSQGEVGYAVNPIDVKEICAAILKVIENYSAISSRCLLLSENFSWDKIGRRYAGIY